MENIHNDAAKRRTLEKVESRHNFTKKKKSLVGYAVMNTK